MLKICDSVITDLLTIIFKNCIDCGVFPDNWKMSHIIPAHKKNDKCSLNNNCLVSLLCICGEIFEIIIYIFLFLEDNNLLNPNQSGFRPNWKMLFNPDITKQPQEVIFSHKSTMLNHPTIFFDETPVAHTSCQKHLRMHLDEK